MIYLQFKWLVPNLWLSMTLVFFTESTWMLIMTTIVKIHPTNNNQPREDINKMIVLIDESTESNWVCFFCWLTNRVIYPWWRIENNAEPFTIFRYSLIENVWQAIHLFMFIAVCSTHQNFNMKNCVNLWSGSIFYSVSIKKNHNTTRSLRLLDGKLEPIWISAVNIFLILPHCCLTWMVWSSI